MKVKSPVFLRVLWTILLLVGVAFVGGCAQKHDASVSREPPLSAASAQHQLKEERKEGGGDDQKKPVERKLIRDAELHLEVGSYEELRPTIDTKLEAVKGYLANARVEHTEGGVSSAVLVMRIPSAKLDEFVRECSGLGTVLRENVQTRDITEEYYDAQARLDNARRLEARYLQLVDTETNNLADLLAVERELARVREEIERIEGRLRLFDNQVAMSELMLRVTTRDRFTAGESVGLGEQVSRTWSASLQALVATGRGLILLVVALFPWLAVLGVCLVAFYYTLVALLRRWTALGRALGYRVGPAGAAGTVGPAASATVPEDGATPAKQSGDEGQREASAGGVAASEASSSTDASKGHRTE